MNNVEKSMMLVIGTIQEGDKEEDTFKMIPISKDCPYNEAVYYFNQRVLFVMSKEKKACIQKFKNNKEILIDKYYEYFITTYSEIVDFVKLFASNTDTFHFENFMKK